MAHATPYFNEKASFWSYFSGVTELYHGDSLSIGDLNEIFYTNEKYGVKPINIQKSFLIQFVDFFRAFDITSNGPKFTWTNKQSTQTKI